MSLDHTLVDLQAALAAANIDSMVIGGYAAAVHGEPRFTADLDLTLGIDTDRLDEALKALTPRFTPLPEDPQAFALKTNVLPVEDAETGVKADLIFTFIGFERDAISRAISVPVGGRAAKVVTAEDLAVYKAVAGRPRDWEDIRSILAKKPDILDLDFIRRNLKEFDAILGSKAAESFEQILAELRRA